LKKSIFLSINPTYQELHATFLSLARRVKELEGLANQHQELIQEHQRLIKENGFLIKQNQLLLKENSQLKDQLFAYQNPKNSRNSSMPPSKDKNLPKPNQSLRKSSGRKVGGQKGRKGKTLEMTAHPDQIIELVPDYCTSCGNTLEDFSAQKEQTRQIVDIPPVKAIFKEYQIFSKICNCGCKSTADFPSGINTPISYGKNIEGLVAYFHARQFLPFARMQEVFNAVFNINISEGGIHCLLNRFSEKTKPIYEIIKQRISTSAVIGADETGVKVNGSKQWFWTWQTPNLTYITHSKNRKGETVTDHFPNGFPNSTLVHDGWKPQLNTLAKNHQSCLPHLQRRLNYLNLKYENANWGLDFSKLLYDALELKKTIPFQNKQHNIERAKIIQRLQCLLEEPPDKNNKELFSFYKRMRGERQHLFTFLFLENVPADNNASERAIRNVKVKQKISGQFKIEQAAQNFAQIRSIIDTIIKNGLNVLEGLALIAKFEFQLLD
jgi:transposase